MAGLAGPSFGGPGFARVVSVVVLLLQLLMLLLLWAQLGRLEGWAQPSLLIATVMQPGESKLGGYVVVGQEPRLK